MELGVSAGDAVMARMKALSKKRYFPAACFSAAGLGMAFFFLKPVFFTSFFFLLASISILYKKVLPLSIGFELASFSAILAGILFGGFSAFIVGFGSIVVSGMLMQKFATDGAKYTFHAVMTGVMGIAASALPIGNIVFWGMGMIVLYDLIFTLWVLNYYPQGMGKLFIWVGTHIPISYWIFATFGEKTLAWVAGFL